MQSQLEKWYEFNCVYDICIVARRIIQIRKFKLITHALLKYNMIIFNLKIIFADVQEIKE